MKRFVIAMFIAASSATQAGEKPVGEAEGGRLVNDYFRAQKTGICNVHSIQMEKKLVPIRWGLVEYDANYSSAEIRHFPNAQEYVNGGCVVDEKKVGKLVPV